ncbi:MULTISPECIES: AraC family transcriptional regulator [unclassified Maridesulfovibrio]|uniref:AraC family transcriptional regulator n=1 Tax=unclassified Maridesulfovibrio TaxID=2794999 RepID=UPI003B3EE67B
MSEKFEYKPSNRWRYPRKELQPYVDRYWEWSGRSLSGDALPRILPGTGEELFFHYGEPFTYELDAGVKSVLSLSHVVCLRSKVATFFPSRTAGFISIRFKAGMFRSFCRVSPFEIKDTLTDGVDLFGRRGTELGERIVEAGDFDERVFLLEDFLIKNMIFASAEDRLIPFAADRLYYGYSVLNSKSVSESVGLGIRQFQRRFKSEVGVTPKQYMCLSRFHQTVRDCLLGSYESMLNCALAHGYYDQAHFIHDFNNYTGYSPSYLLGSDTRMTHFYNTSRPRLC